MEYLRAKRKSRSSRTIFIEDLTLDAGLPQVLSTAEQRPQVRHRHLQGFGAEFAPDPRCPLPAALQPGGRAHRTSRSCSRRSSSASTGPTDPCAGRHHGRPTSAVSRRVSSVGQSPTANPAGQYNGLLGGNPNLNPEKATTKTLGVVLQPRLPSALCSYGRLVQHRREGRDPGLRRRCDRGEPVSSSRPATTVSPACALIIRDPAGSIWLTRAVSSSTRRTTPARSRPAAGTSAVAIQPPARQYRHSVDQLQRHLSRQV